MNVLRLRPLLQALAICALSLMSGAPAEAAPANSLRELFHNIDLCLKKASIAQAGEITIYFSLRQDGSLFGRPRVTYVRVWRDSAEQSRFMESVAAALDSCMPAQITPSLGMAIAGRPLSIRIVLKDRETDI